MLKKTNDPWCSPKGANKLKEFAKDIASFCKPSGASHFGKMADYVRSVHFDKLNRTVCACNGKIGILLSFPDGPVTDAFFPPLITAHLAKHKQGDPAIANALALFTLTKRLNVIVGPDPAYNTDPGYPRLGMTLAPGPQYGIVPWDGGLDFPPDRMATLAEFIDKYAAGRSPWMTFDNKTAPRVKPALMHIVVPLDPATTANAVVFMLPDPEPKTVTEETVTAAKNVIGKFF